MTAELTAEQIVTNLLSKNEIIKLEKENSFIVNNKNNLGEYLTNLADKNINQITENKNNKELPDKSESSKYSFIRGRWII